MLLRLLNYGVAALDAMLEQLRFDGMAIDELVVEFEFGAAMICLFIRL